MKNTTETHTFLRNIEQLVGVRLRLVTPSENNRLEDYIQEAPPVLASYLYNRFYKMDIPGELQKGRPCHVKYLLGIENIYIPVNEDCFIGFGPFSSDFLSADEIEGRLLGAGLSFTPSLYRFFAKELPILPTEQKKSALQLIFQFFEIPEDNQTITSILLPDEQRIYPNSESLVDLAEHEKMLYRYEQSLQIAASVSEGDYGKCMENLKSALEYQITHQYSNDDKTNETITAARIGETFYHAAIKGNVSPLEAENIYTKHIREILNADSVDTIRKISRSMLRTFCDAVKNNSEVKYSSIVQKMANYLSLLGGEELDMEEISRIFKNPIGILEREFRRETGFTLRQYHRKLRLHRAAVLLTETALPINQIATQTGFLDQNYFSRQFKKLYKCSPSEYRYSSIIRN